MPDIAMCLNETCLIKNNCYRFTAKPNPYRQSYCDFKPSKDTSESGCEDYIPNKDESCES